MPQTEIICVGCPLGCRVMLTVGPDFQIESMAGNRCQEGVKYATAEYKNPVRILTATVMTEDSRLPVLPVKTDNPVPMAMLREIMRVVARTRIKAPVEMGQVIIHDIPGTGANLVATGTL